MQNIGLGGVSQGVGKSLHNRPATPNDRFGSGTAVPAASADRPVCPHCRHHIALSRTGGLGHERSWQRGKGAGTRRIASAEVGHV
jgi:hypothetical protein